MRVLAIDPAIKTGFCIGLSNGRDIFAGSVRLIGANVAIEQLPVNADSWLSQLIEREKPDWIGMEEWEFGYGGHTTADTTKAKGLLHGAIRAAAGRYRIPISTVRVATWRKGFCGAARANAPAKRGHSKSQQEKRQDSKDNKAMVLNRAIALGMLPRGSADTDAADACGIWSHTVIENRLGTPKSLVLYGEAML